MIYIIQGNEQCFIEDKINEILNNDFNDYDKNNAFTIKNPCWRKSYSNDY